MFFAVCINKAGHAYVKGWDFFVEQGGLAQSWGAKWFRVEASSTEAARAMTPPAGTLWYDRAGELLEAHESAAGVIGVIVACVVGTGDIRLLAPAAWACSLHEIVRERPASGSRWRHHAGSEYAVIDVDLVSAPPTVRCVEGAQPITKFALREWARVMTPIADAVPPVEPAATGRAVDHAAERAVEARSAAIKARAAARQARANALKLKDEATKADAIAAEADRALARAVVACAGGVS